MRFTWSTWSTYFWCVEFTRSRVITTSWVRRLTAFNCGVLWHPTFATTRYSINKSARKRANCDTKKKIPRYNKNHKWVCDRGCVHVKD